MNIETTNHSEDIKKWISILQKSLTLEIQFEFSNILGKERYFNDFLYENLNNIDHLNLDDEKILLLENLSNKFKIYNDLNLSQRKRLIIDTRKILFKISKDIDHTFQNNNNSSNYKHAISNSFLTLKSDISNIKGVGNVIKDNLNQIGLYSVNDLIKYFPRTYLDYTRKEKIKNLRPYNLYTCIGNIKKFYIYKSKNNSNLTIMNITIFDETSSIRVTKFFIGKRFRSYTFFSSQKEKYKIGIKLAISGKIKITEYGRAFVDPQIEILNSGENNFFSGKILPIYSLNDCITNINFIKIIKKIISCSEGYHDILNEKQRKNLSLLSIKESLINIHLPSSKYFLSESKKRLVFDELLLLQLKFLIKRNNKKKYVLKSNFQNQKSLLNDFFCQIPFKLTNSQVNVFEEIKTDLSSINPMSRLLQGDVGSGKTIIAIASLVFIIERGFQGAFMVPTEVLADQHYQNLLKILSPLLISVELLTGNTSQKERRRILNDLVNGQINILVGTHALFEEKVLFNSLGLVVIDEQHRFGVNQRNQLLKKGACPHLLSMTATPIPRTLALSIYGDLDVSKINELPPGRVPVETKIISEDNLEKLFRFVEIEIKKGRQAYVILPLIEDSEKLNLNSANNIYKYLSDNVFRDFNVGLLHGKLSSQEKNQIIDLFSQNKVNILVSTTVIEVGIDVPNASIMVIYNSERFGLSQLHQLRGRVGRDSYKSFCYLITSKKNSINNKRLEVLQKSNDGFYIAEKDLEIRGPGQILGYKQSGLPDFVLDNLPKNKILIEKARMEAQNIIDKDPNLDNNQILKNIIFNKSGNKFIHEFLN